MAMEMFKVETSIQAVHVPYRGESQGLQDLLAGNIDMMFGTLSIMMPLVEDGKLLALAVGTTNRSVAVPVLHTVREELKLHKFNFDSWFGIMVPSGTPPDRVKILSEAFKRTLARPAVQEALLKRGVEPVAGADSFDAFLSRNISEYAEVIRKANITLE
jgi:tripartite-type tricarboxylate transporter receptor subunit TctC